MLHEQVMGGILHSGCIAFLAKKTAVVGLGEREEALTWADARLIEHLQLAYGIGLGVEHGFA